MSDTCVLCGATSELSDFVVSGASKGQEATLALCGVCTQEIASDTVNADHWRCLREAIWSPIAAVQVQAYRLLKKAESEAWASDILSGAYLEDDVLAWANAGLTGNDDGQVYRDSNGVSLSEGDSVTLIKDLEVKGAGFTAKRGTLVKGIHLTDNPLHIEGKINGQTIVIIAAYTKKA